MPCSYRYCVTCDVFIKMTPEWKELMKQIQYVFKVAQVQSQVLQNCNDFSADDSNISMMFLKPLYIFITYFSLNTLHLTLWMWLNQVGWAGWLILIFTGGEHVDSGQGKMASFCDHNDEHLGSTTK